MLSILMVPVYGKDTTGHKAGRAGFAMSKMVAMHATSPSKFLPLCCKIYHSFKALLNSVCICVALLVFIFIIL